MTFFHAAHSLSELLFFLPSALQLPGGPHRLAVPTGGEFARKWLQPFRKFISYYFQDHFDFVATSPDERADLKAAPCPSFIAAGGYKLAHALWCGLKPSKLPRHWIPCEASSRSGVVIARSLTEHNEFFPWEKVLERYSNHRLTFCGTLVERENFLRKFPSATFDWVDSTDLVAATELLASSLLLISNQNSIAVLADGLELPVVLEVSLLSQTMLHPRRQVFPSVAGRTFLPCPEDVTQGSWVTSPVPEAILRVHWPRGYDTKWVHPDPEHPRQLLKFSTLEEAEVLLCGIYKRPLGDPLVRESVIHHTLVYFPGELLPSLHHKSCQRVVRALQRFQGPFPLKDYFFQPDADPPELKLLTSDPAPESSPQHESRAQGTVLPPVSDQISQS